MRSAIGDLPPRAATGVLSSPRGWGLAHPDAWPASTSTCWPSAATRAPAEPTAEEKAYARQLEHWLREETGYQWIQGTRPQTLAYGLTDSPAGLAAWIVEKFRAWSDCGGDVERRFPKDTLLTNIMLYWITGAINSSFCLLPIRDGPFR
jgi:microsomal epoxide hydrolase